MYKMYHLIGVPIDAKNSVDQLDDEQLMKVVERDKDRYLELGRTCIPHEEQDQMSDADMVRLAIAKYNLYNQVAVNIIRQMVYKHNWIRCYMGMPAGGSEWDIESEEQLLVVGVQAHEILLGLNMTRDKFTEWFVDHLNTLGLGSVSKNDIKYFHLVEM